MPSPPMGTIMGDQRGDNQFLMLVQRRHKMHTLKTLLLSLLLALAVLPLQAQDAADQPDATLVPHFDSQGYLRLGHFIADEAEAVDMFINGELVADNLDFPTISPWLVLPTGSHELAISATGDTAENALLQTSVAIVQDTWLTLGLVGTPETIEVSHIQQAMHTELPSTAQVTFANALPSGKNVNFTRDEVIFVAGVPVTTGAIISQSSIPTDAHTHTYNILGDGDTPLLANGSELETVDTSAYLIIAVGPDDDPQIIINETPKWEISMLSGDIETPATLLEAARAEPLAAPFLTAVAEAGLTDLLADMEPITIFAPADYIMDDVDLSRNDLADILRHHIVAGNYKAGDLFLENPTLTTIDGDTLSLSQTEQGFVDNAQIIQVNIAGSNGTMHIINALLTPGQ